VPETTYVLKVQIFPLNESIPYDFFFQPNHGIMTYEVEEDQMKILLPTIK
jgi:hypothetical protein